MKKKDKKKKCPKCRFFVSEADDLYVDGHCRRYPPTIINNFHDSAYPTVVKYFWCGEFKCRT